MPNPLAYLALALWPLVSFGLYKKLSAGRALLASLMLAYLFLPPPPAAFDFPLIPALGKDNMPGLIALMLCFVFHHDRLQLIPQSAAARLLLALFVLAPIPTALTNSYPVFFGQIGLPGMGIKDAISLVIQQFMLAIPFLLARRFLQEEKDQRDLLWVIAISGLIYSLPMLLEVRLSPQLNLWIYGFFQHSFDQMIRYGGFRPIVFLYHGLWVAFLALSAVASLAILMRTELAQHRGKLAGALVYMLVVLVLCKSTAALLYAVALIPLLFLAPRWLQMRLALVLALATLAYPVLKSADLVPEEALLEQAAKIDLERAGSLKFRLDNETVLLNRALEKPVFGWGSWGRNQILDPITGSPLTVADGRWVIVLGAFGWIGFIAEFGLLALPVVMLWARTRRHEGALWSPYIGGLSLFLGVNLVDLLPNATLTPMTWLIAGALLGHAETVKLRQKPPKTKLQSVM